MKITKVLGTVVGALSGFYWAGVTYAEESDLLEFMPDNPLKEDDLVAWIQGTLNTVILLAALVCVGVLIASGYSYITAAGDEQKIEKATKTLTFAIVGLVICFISVIIVQFVVGNLLT